MADKIVTLTTFYDVMEAEIVRGRLEANGISCFIADGLYLTVNPLYNQAAGGIKIKVFEDDVAKCKEILSEKIEIEGPIDLCPICHSQDIYYGPASIIKNWFAFLSFLLNPVFLYFIHRTWQCKTCGNKFNQPKTIETSFPEAK